MSEINPKWTDFRQFFATLRGGGPLAPKALSLRDAADILVKLPYALCLKMRVENCKLIIANLNEICDIPVVSEKIIQFGIKYLKYL